MGVTSSGSDDSVDGVEVQTFAQSLDTKNEECVVKEDIDVNTADWLIVCVKDEALDELNGNISGDVQENGDTKCE